MSKAKLDVWVQELHFSLINSCCDSESCFRNFSLFICGFFYFFPKTQRCTILLIALLPWRLCLTRPHQYWWFAIQTKTTIWNLFLVLANSTMCQISLKVVVRAMHTKNEINWKEVFWWLVFKSKTTIWKLIWLEKIL